MKKQLMVLPLMAALLVTGCKGKKNTTSNSSCSCQEATDPYQISESTFTNKFSPHAVMFESNYGMRANYNGEFRNTVDFENGKMKSTFKNGYINCFEVKDSNGSVEYSMWQSPNGGSSYYKVSDKQILTYDYVYDYFFGDYIFFFGLQYSDLTYNKTKKAYEVSNKKVAYGEHSGTIKYVSIQARDNEPLSMYFIDGENNEITYDFFGHGTTHVTLPA